MIYLLIIIHWKGYFYFATSNAIGFGSNGWIVTPMDNDNNLLLTTYQHIDKSRRDATSRD